MVPPQDRHGEGQPSRRLYLSVLVAVREAYPAIYCEFAHCCSPFAPPILSRNILTAMQPQNWAEIAKKCNTTVGAASKRYSRMKKAFEENRTAPGTSPRSPAKSTPAMPKNTPKSTPKKTAKANNETQASPAGAKRKRMTDTTLTTTEDAELMPSLDADEELPDVKLKRTKVGKNKVKVTPKPKAKTTIKKEISEDDAEDAFYDAEEGIGEGIVAAESTHERKSYLSELPLYTS